MRKYLFIIATILLVPALSWGACTDNGDGSWTCSSWADLETCVESNSPSGCNTDGNEITLSAGSYTATSKITIGTAITVQGVGNGSDAGSNTVLSGTQTAFDIEGDDGDVIRLSNMRLTGSLGLEVSGDSKDWRIDNIYFYQISSAPLGSIVQVQNDTTGTTGYTNGVIDHCTFYQPAERGILILPDNDGAGNQTWNRTLGLGTKDAIYIEDCTWEDNNISSSDPVLDDRGENYVFRNNTVINGYIENHDAIVDNFRGTRKFEIYDNDFTRTVDYYWHIHLRSGTGVVYNNTFEGNSTATSNLAMALYRTYQTGGDPWDVLCSSSSGKACLNTDGTYARGCTTDADCGGIAGSCIDIDGDGSSPKDGWPCRDQIGTSSGGVQTGGESPALFWNNKSCSTSPCTPTAQNSPFISSAAATDYYTEGVDYCVGTTAMPGTCNEVPSTYTAYTYPHPLVSPDEIPPDITITSPADDPHPNGTDNDINIAVTLTDNVEASSAQWYNAATTGGGAMSCSGTTTSKTCSATVALASGNNLITVTGYDSSSNTDTDTVTVSYSPVAATEPIRGSASSGAQMH